MQKVEYIGSIDAPQAGCYLSNNWREFTVFGITLIAANSIHANDLALRQLLGETSRYNQSGQCDHCGAHIQNVVVFKDSETGRYFATGIDCARFFESNLDKEAYRLRRKELAVKQTKNGSYYNSRPVPQYVWSIPREKRPDWMRISKFEAPGRSRSRATWYLTVFGDSVAEVVSRMCELEDLKS